MYVYKITNKINGKKYIGITNNYKRRWSNHKCCSDPSMVIAKAIKKYGQENFIFEVLYSGLTIEQSEQKEKELIISENSLVPNGYNVSKGGLGLYGIGKQFQIGSKNPNAHLNEEEVKYIKSNRNIPMYVLYDEFSEKIGYQAFKNIYNDESYKNIKPTIEKYPNNFEFSCQFTNSKLDYGDIFELRQMYNKGVHWEIPYQKYKELFPNKWSFWEIYSGRRYKKVCPEVFSEENKKIHSSLSKSGSKNPKSKLNEEDVLIIRKMFKNGKSRAEICKKYPNVTRTTINYIITRKTWKNI